MDGDLRVKIAATGERATGRNEINARFQANELRNLRGKDCGVLDNTLYDASTDFLGITRADAKEKPFTLSVNGNTLTLGAGMATAYGYDLQIEDAVTLDASAIASGRTFFVCLEWDLSATPYPTGDAVLHDNGTAKIWRGCKDGDNLIEIEEGVYDLPIYRLTKTASGATIDGDWRDLRLCDEPRGVQVANTAVYAATKSADDGTDAAATTIYADDAARDMANTIRSDGNTILSSIASSVNSSLLSVSSYSGTIGGVATLHIYKLSCGIVYGEMEWEAASSSERLSSTPWAAGDVLITLTQTAIRPAKTEYCDLLGFSHWDSRSNYAGNYWCYRCSIGTDGAITVISRYGDMEVTGYEYYTGALSLHFAYTTSKASITAGQISDFTFYPVTATGTNVYIAAPSFCKRGRSFKIRAEAVHPFSEASLTISGGTLDKTTGNGEFTVTPSSSTSSVTITATERYIDGATDENGNTSY